MLVRVRGTVLAWTWCGVVAGLAAPIPGLFNTGMDAVGSLLPGGATDPHWRLVVSADPRAPGPAAFVVREGYPIPPWLENGPASKWIAPQANQSGGNSPGDYVYQLAFDLTGYDAATAVITGRWSSDNAGLEVRLNGEPTGLTFGGDFAGFSSDFDISSGFVEGANVLEFVVNNAGDGLNPTGFRAELAGTVEPWPPPGIPPTVTRQPEDILATPGETVAFSVTASGSRPFRYQWRLDGSPLAEANAAVFRIAAVNTNWAGGYDVVVQNDWGAVTSRVATLAVRAASLVEPGYEPLGPSSRRTGIAISEIMYHPAPRADGRDLEFIELYNSNPFFEDLSGWRLSGDADFTFPERTVLAGNAFLVVARRPDDVRTEHGLTNVVGGYDGALGDQRGLVRLRKRSGAVLLEVRYADEAPWPVAADGAGPSLVLARPSLGEADPRAWAASAQAGGSPGRLEPLSGAASVAPLPGDHEAVLEGAAGPSNPLPDRELPPFVINELLYHPPSGDNADEFIELFNSSSETVPLGGWRLTDAVEFEFPPEAVVPAGGFAVVTPDRARFLAAHPGLDSERVWGDYQGSLDNREERVALVRPETEVRTTPTGLVTNRLMVVVSEVMYRDGGRWGRWADGGGSSLELRDARADTRLAPNWADSDETGKAPWTTIEATGVLSLAHPGVPQADQLQILLLGAGEALVDDVEVLVNGVNRISNGSFEGGVAGWAFQGTHRPSRGEDGEGFQSARSLRVVATDRGDHVANRVRTALKSPIPTGTTATIRARVRWLRGHPEILLRLRNGALEASGRLALPRFAGTPGTPNSRAVSNAGPAITDVQHYPVLPVANQPVRVTARVRDPDGVSSVMLGYRVDPAPETGGIVMTDDGGGADAAAGDGVFTGSLPGQPRGALVAFWIEAYDGATTSVSAQFPEDAPARECLVRFGETVVPGAFATYRLWMTQAAHDRWAVREKMSNEDLDVTFVYGTNRVIYNAGAHYSGSSYSAPGYSSPTGALCGYDVRFPKDDRFLGDNRLTLDWPIRDDTDQREQLMFWFLEQYGLPNMYRRYVHLFVNGARRGTIYDDVQQPGDDTVSEWFPDDADGTLWKTDCWNEFDSVGNRVDPCILNTLERFPSAGPLKVARYRWNWRPRAVRGSANDFADLFALVTTVNTTSNYVATVEAHVDVDHWMRTFAMNDLASYWDGFGNPNAKNTFLYRPQRDGWKLFCWDFDVGLGVFNDPPNAALFEVNDPTLRRMYQTPAFVRRYWAALEEAMNGFFRTGAGTPLDTLLEAKYAAFRANQVNLANPAPIKTWIAQRRSFLQSQLNTVRAGFALTTQSGRDFATDASPVALAGSAPVAVRTLRVSGVSFPPSWTAVTNWAVNVPLAAGLNELTFEGFDRLGQPVAGATDTIRVTYTGLPPAPERLVINEWMAANTGALADPGDGAFEDWFELYNPGTNAVALTGWRLTDDPAEPARFIVPAGYVVPPHGCLLVWADGQPEQSRPGGDLHVNFRLRQEGERIELYNPAGALVDAVVFGPQLENVSEGRWPDAMPKPFYPVTPPSPGQPNTAPPASWPGIRVLGARWLDGGGFALSWTADPGRTYLVRYCDRLAGEDVWEQAGPAVMATGDVASFSDVTATREGFRFYRIQLVQP